MPFFVENKKGVLVEIPKNKAYPHMGGDGFGGPIIQAPDIQAAARIRTKNNFKDAADIIRASQNKVR